MASTYLEVSQPSITVNGGGGGGGDDRTLITTYNEVTGVVNGVTTLIASYTAIANTYLQKIDFSGTNIAEYELVINSATKDKKRTHFSGGLNASFDFNNGLLVSAGQLIEIYVVHNRPTAGDFNARIQILQGS